MFEAFLSHAADQPYVPEPIDEGNAVVEFLTSTQAILGVVAVLVALVLLMWSLWTSRREAREMSKEREEKG
jgi:heme/copper-type cytochrome/quinol oxidase subunit 2